MGAALLFLSIGIISANTLSLESNNDGTWNVNFSSNADIGGFQFDVDDVTVNSASGGEAAANGFFMSNSSTTVLGFSLSGSTIPAGNGTLVVVNVTGTPIGLSEIIIADAFGNQLDFTYLPSEDDGPADFAFNQSMQQAAYFFEEVTINGILVSPDDWVGAFNGDICVGAQQWDPSQCLGEVCSINVMGNDGGDYTMGYCNPGDIPTFKIYDASENIYYTAFPTEEASWSINGFNFIDGLSNGSSGCTNTEACNYNPNATEDDGSCVFADENYDCDGNCVVDTDCSGECGGTAELDECGVCGGDGIADGACDCDGNVDAGCGCGEAGPSGCDNVCGSTLEDDECGVCGGDGIADGACDCTGNVDLGCGCNLDGPSGCDMTCGSTLENDECGVCGGDGTSCGPLGTTILSANENNGIIQIFYNSSADFAGFEFVVQGAEIISAFGGMAEDNEFYLSNNEFHVLGFTLDDSNISFGEGLLVNLEANIDNSIELSNIIVADVSGTPLSVCFDSGGGCTPEPNQMINGCFDPSACTFNPDATSFIVSMCEYPEENYDCEGNCVAGIDCAGVCGGGAIIDECGICDGDGANTECWDDSMVCDPTDCDDEPSEDPFTYSQSTLQAFYYFETVAINGIDVEGDDWVGAFNGDICVGARKWDTLLCGNGICDVPVMGDDGSEVTVGYMNTGEFPTFKIYDASENTYYDAVPDSGEPWGNFALYTIPNLSGWIWGCTDSSACNYDEAATMDDGNCLENDCTGECGGTAIIDECGICEGDGISAGECDCYGNVIDCNWDCGGIAVEDACGVCAGDGPLAGYTCAGTPELFDFNQSTLQAFYYFTLVTLNGLPLDDEDWVGAFNGDICVGSRKWDTSLCNSGVCDLPIMGADENEWTDDYLQPGDIPTFKVFDGSTNEYFEAIPSENIAWYTNDFNMLDLLQGGDLGCTDEVACNFDQDAIVDDGSCILPEEYYDCDGNCVAEIDCEGECGGSADLDECGVCDGNGAEEGFNCDGIPLEFVYNHSSLQAFYYIYEASDMAGNPLTAEDWVGIFNGETCVGSHQWDTSLCNNGVCDVPAMGNDGYDYSEGYLLPGDYPSFKIYDYSEGDYFDAFPSENYPFENAGIFNINELVLDLSYSIPLTQYNNLMSFYVLPEDVTVGNVMLDIQENIVAISGEATSAQYFFEEDYWTGTLMNLDISSGYWMRVAEEDTLDGSGHSYDPGRVYNLHSGANLVSFPSTGSVGISAGLPDEIEDNVLAVLGEGMSTVNSDEGWEGSLMDFKALHGYWIITDEEISFSYNLESLEPLSRKINPYLATEVPHGFDYIQSTQQAFYYVEDIKLINGEIENGDWLFSYCGNTVTGARQWLGRTVDIPAMGTEGNMMTAGYCGVNDTPHFKLLKSNSQELIALHAETPKWQPNGIFFLGSLEEAAPLPSEFAMFAAYPNPFNPITQIRYEIPAEGNLEISIFDLRGQKVETLENEFIQPGEYTTNWDASHVASGVYFVHFTALGEGRPPISQIQKLMLVK